MGTDAQTERKQDLLEELSDDKVGALLVEWEEYPGRIGFMSDDLYSFDGKVPVTFPCFENGEDGPGPLEVVPVDEIRITNRFIPGSAGTTFARRAMRTARDYFDSKRRALSNLDSAMGSLEDRRSKIEGDWMASTEFFDGNIEKMRSDEADAQAAADRLTEVLYLARETLSFEFDRREESGE